MAALEGQAAGVTGTSVAGFKSAGLVNPEKKAEEAAAVPGIANQEEIELDDDDAGDKGGEMDVEERPLPEGVLGSLAKRQRTE